MKFCLPLLLILFSCKNQNESHDIEARCMPVLEEIVKTQRARDIVRSDFEITIIDYSEGRITQETWNREKSVWLEKENQLAGLVNQLYDYSYETECLK